MNIIVMDIEFVLNQFQRQSIIIVHKEAINFSHNFACWVFPQSYFPFSSSILTWSRTMNKFPPSFDIS